MNKLEALWKIVGRYDHYIATTNQKAAATIAYNTIIVGGLILKYRDMLGLFDQHPRAIHVAAILLVSIAVCSLASLWCTFLMILPYLWSPAKADSVIFFGDVANHDTAEKYFDQINKVTEEQFTKDLSVQTFALATGVKKKFRWMRVGICLVLFVQIPLMAILLALKLMTLA